MRKNNFLLFIAAIAGMLTGCQKQHLLVYQAENNIYFNRTIEDVGFDTAIYSFSTDTLTRASLPIPIGIMGRVTSEKRPFVLTVVADSTTAVAGRDYILPADTALYIQPDSVGYPLSVTLLRSSYLRQRSVVLFLRLDSNNNFKTNMPVKDSRAIRPRSAITFKLTLDDSLQKPWWWGYSIGDLGTFSRKKVDLFVPFMAGLLSYNLFVKQGAYYPGLLHSQSALFQKWLNAQAAAGNTILDDDGAVMVMGDDVQ